MNTDGFDIKYQSKWDIGKGLYFTDDASKTNQEYFEHYKCSDGSKVVYIGLVNLGKIAQDNGSYKNEIVAP